MPFTVPCAMRVQIVDPSAFTPPYDHALCAALARAGADVELITSRFLYGPVPREQGYEVTELFYRRAARRGLEARGRRALKLAEHVPDMRRLARHTRRAAPDVVHWQWVTVPGLDRILMPSRRPRVFTVHYPLPPGRLARARQRALLRGMDAVIAHSEHGAARLRDELGLDPARVHTIEHGAFDYLTRLPEERPLPPELCDVEGPVVLFFGLLRPYKGAADLLEAFRSIEGAELWIVGRPMMDLGPLYELAARAKGTVRFVPRFITDPEIPAYFRRADIVVLPYREIEQSGVLYTALAFRKPLVLSTVGGFTELALEHGVGLPARPGNPRQIADAIEELLGDDELRESMATAAAVAAAGPYSWDAVAAKTLALYQELLAG